MIHIHRSKDKQFYFTVNGRNGQVIVTSETYTRKSDAIRGAKAFIKYVWKIDEFIIDKLPE